MTLPTSWNKTFERSLLVDNPERHDILAELHHHMQYGDKNRFGDPKKLAFAYNRTHLGFFCSIPRLLLMPFVLWMLLFATAGMISWLQSMWPPAGPGSIDSLWVVPVVVMLCLCLVLFLVTAHSLARLLFPIRALGMMMLVFVASSIVVVGAVILPELLTNSLNVGDVVNVIVTDAAQIYSHWLAVTFFATFVPLTAFTFFMRMYLERKRPL